MLCRGRTFAIEANCETWEIRDRGFLGTESTEFAGIIFHAIWYSVLNALHRPRTEPSEGHIITKPHRLRRDLRHIPTIALWQVVVIVIVRCSYQKVPHKL
jgi:hypothetical protein